MANIRINQFYALCLIQINLPYVVLTRKISPKKINGDGHMFRLLISHAFTPLGDNSVVVENIDIEDLDFDLIEEASNPGTPRKFRVLRSTPQKRPRTEG